MNGEKSKGTMPTITYYYRKYRNFTQFYGVGILWKRAILPKHSGNCAFPQNFQTGKSRELRNNIVIVF